MNFVEVCDVFGGTPFPGEVRTDPWQVRQRIDRLKYDYDHFGLSAEIAISLLRAVECIFDSRHKDAEEILQKIMKSANENVIGKRWGFRACSYYLLNMTYIKYPPLVEGVWAPDGPSEIFLEADYWNKTTYEKLLGLAELFQDAGLPIDHLEYNTFNVVWTIANQQKRLYLDRNSQLDGICDEATTELHYGFVTGHIGNRVFDIETVKKEAMNISLTKVARYLDRRCLEMDRARAARSFGLGLQQMHECLSEEDDIVGLANCKVMFADNILCGPETSPIFLGQVMQEQWDPNPDTKWQSTLSQPLITPQAAYLLTLYLVPTDKRYFQYIDQAYQPPENLTGRDPGLFRFQDKCRAALTLYLDSRRLMMGAKASRGVAWISLRIYSLMWMFSQRPSYCWSESKVYTSPLQELFYEMIQSASQTQDCLLEKILSVYQMLQKDETMSSLDQARELGFWAKENHTYFFAKALGILSHQCGNFFRYTMGLASSAIQCYEFARLLFFRQRSFKVCWFAAIDSLVSIHVSLGRFQDARVMLDDLRMSLHNLLKDITNVKHLSEGKIMHTTVSRILVGRVLLHYIEIYPLKGLMSTEEFIELYRLQTLHNSFSDTTEEHTESNACRDLIDFLKLRPRQFPDIDRADGTSFQFFRTVYLPFVRRQRLQICSSNFGSSIQAMTFEEIVTTAMHMQQTVVAQKLVEAWTSDIMAKLQKALKTSSEMNVDVLFSSMMSLGESMLRVAIHSKLWNTADIFWEFLDGLTSTYEHTVSSCSSFYKCIAPSCSTVWHWQRLLWYGLIRENTGECDVALQNYLRSWWCTVKIGKPRLLDREAFLHTLEDFGRLITCIARMYLHVRSGHLQLKQAPQHVLNNPSQPLIDFKEGIIYAHQKDAELAGESALEWMETERARYVYDMQALDHMDIPLEEKRRILDSHRVINLYKELRGFSVSRNHDEEVEMHELHRSARESEYHLHDELRKLPGLFGQSKRVIGHRQLLECIPQNTITVHLTLSDDGLGTMCMDCDTIRHCRWDAEVSKVQVTNLVSRYLKIMNEEKINASIAELGSISSYLSRLVLEPIKHVIMPYEKIAFVPSGPLCNFPPAALILDGDYLMLQKITWHIPSLAFQYYQDSKDEQGVKCEKPMTAIGRRPSSIRDILMSRRPESNLPMAGIEALVATRKIGSEFNPPLDGRTMTRQQFREQLQHSNVMHVCAHGNIDGDRPLNSYISLGERLRILDLEGVRSNASLVVFSTCLSGAGSVLSNDDISGFAHPVLATGASLFAGCIWHANDVTTLIHSHLVYVMMTTSQGARTNFAEIWYLATQFLACLDVSQAQDMIRRIIGILDKMEAAGLKPGSYCPTGRRDLERVMNELVDANGKPLIDFKNPYIWGPFLLVGHGGRSFRTTGGQQKEKIAELRDASKEATSKIPLSGVFRRPFLGED